MKSLSDTHLWSRKTQLNFGSHLDPESESGLRIWTHRSGLDGLGGGLRCPSTLFTHKKALVKSKNFQQGWRWGERWLTNASTLSTISLKAAVTLAGIALCAGVVETLRVDVTQTRHVVAILLCHCTTLVATPYTRQSVFIAATQALLITH